MKVFDLHCDTIMAIGNEGERLYSNSRHISLERASAYDAFTQVFAIFIPDDLRGPQAVDYFDRLHAYYLKEMAENKEIISDYFEKRETKMKSVLAVEGGAAANGSLEGLHHLYDCGVRLMTLTWNGRNELGSGTFDNPDCGLTMFGVRAVQEMERLGMVVDVSHLSKKGFWDVEEIAEKPFIASHSNCDIVDSDLARHRNLDDAQIKCLVERGGLMGLNLYKGFLGEGGDVSFDAVYRHLSHALDLGAEKILALGCDFDGADVAEEISGIEKLGGIYNYLLSKSFGAELCDAIFYNNAGEYFKKLYNI